MQSALPIPPTIPGRCDVSLHPRKRCNRPAFTRIGARYYCGHCCDLFGMRSEVARGLDHFPLAVDRTGWACCDEGTARYPQDSSCDSQCRVVPASHLRMGGAHEAE